MRFHLRQLIVHYAQLFPKNDAGYRSNGDTQEGERHYPSFKDGKASFNVLFRGTLWSLLGLGCMASGMFHGYSRWNRVGALCVVLALFGVLCFIYGVNIIVSQKLMDTRPVYVLQ